MAGGPERLINRLRQKMPIGALISVGGVYSGVVLNFALNLLIARELGAGEYGLIALGLSVVTLLGVAAQFGFSQGCARFIGTYLARDQHSELRGFLNFAQAVPVVVGLGVAVIGIPVVLGFLEPGGRREVIVVALAGVPLYGALLLAQNAARGFGNMLLATLPVFVFLPSAALAALYTLTPPDAAGFMLLYVGIIAVLAVATVLAVHWRVRKEHLRANQARYPIGEWFTVTRPMLLTAFGQQYLRRVDVILLAFFVTPEFLGMYALGARFAQVVGVTRFSVNRFWMPRVARRYAAGDMDGLKGELGTAARVVFWTTLAVTGGLIFLGPYLINFAGFGGGLAYQVMLVLLVGQVAAAYYSPAVQTLQMCGHERVANRLVLLSGLLVTVGVAGAGAFGGAIGAAGSVALVTAFQFWLAGRRVGQLVGIRCGAFD